MKKNVSHSVCLPGSWQSFLHCQLSSGQIKSVSESWRRQDSVSCNLPQTDVSFLSNSTLWKYSAVFIVLLWTETFTPPRAAQTRRPACEKQEVKRVAEAVCVSLFNATQAQSTGRLMLHPKPELVQQTAAVGASMSKETVPLDQHIASPLFAS